MKTPLDATVAAAVANDDWRPDEDPIPDAENPTPADEPSLDVQTKDPT
jgi:hypothetical protein